MSGQSAMMSASESKSVQKSLENGRSPAMKGMSLSTSPMNVCSKGGPKKKPITAKG
jgi:hypothetical protein